MSHNYDSDDDYYKYKYLKYKNKVTTYNNIH